MPHGASARKPRFPAGRFYGRINPTCLGGSAALRRIFLRPEGKPTAPGKIRDGFPSYPDAALQERKEPI